MRAVVDKAGDERPHVVGQVDILGKATDGLVCLGKGRAALEDERCADGRVEQCLESPDNPDILLQKIGRPAGFTRGVFQHLATIAVPEVRIVLSHGRAGSPVPPAIRASAR